LSYWGSGQTPGLVFPQATGSECVGQIRKGKDKIYHALSTVPFESYTLRGYKKNEVMQLLERQKQLQSTIGHISGASPVGVIDDKVPKQDKVSRHIGNSSRNKGKDCVSIKQKWLFRGLVLRKSGRKILQSEHIMDHGIPETLNCVPEV
jgi:hypothetical protein